VFSGPASKGVYSSSVQKTLYETEKLVLERISQVSVFVNYIVLLDYYVALGVHITTDFLSQAYWDIGGRLFFSLTHVSFDTTFRNR
jgi:hypothetical protein